MTKKAPAKTAAKPAAKPLTPWQQWQKREDALDNLCDRIENGETLSDIARNLGCDKAQITRWIAADAQRSARARESRISAASAYDDEALAVIRAAGDPFTLAKAREEASHLRWRASKANPREYGEKLELGGEVGLKSLPDEQMKAEALKLMAKLGLSADATLLK